MSTKLRTGILTHTSVGAIVSWRQLQPARSLVSVTTAAAAAYVSAAHSRVLPCAVASSPLYAVRASVLLVCCVD